MMSDASETPRPNLFWPLAMALAAIALALALAVPSPAKANPSNVSATTFSNFVRVSWNGQAGDQFYCIDTAFSQNDLINLRGTWSNWGCGTTLTSFDLTALQCGAHHYFRIWAAGFGNPSYSEIGQFTAQACNFTPPDDPESTLLSSTSVRLTWDRGQDNLFFCVDLARNQSDLINLTGSFFNTGCGTPGTTLDVSGLACGARYYWRVWSTSPDASGYSPIASFDTSACDFDTDPVTIIGGTDIVILDDVRIGAHPGEGFDRIVFEFEDGLPNETDIEYRNSVAQCGSGSPVSLDGAGNLVVTMHGAQAHNEQGQSTIDDNTLNGTGAAILEAVQTCDFEGVVQWAIGTDQIAGFKVTTLANPDRIVVDILR